MKIGTLANKAINSILKSNSWSTFCLYFCSTTRSRRKKSCPWMTQRPDWRRKARWAKWTSRGAHWGCLGARASSVVTTFSRSLRWSSSRLCPQTSFTAVTSTGSSWNSPSMQRQRWRRSIKRRIRRSTSVHTLIMEAQRRNAKWPEKELFRGRHLSRGKLFRS